MLHDERRLHSDSSHTLFSRVAQNTSPTLVLDGNLQQILAVSGVLESYFVGLGFVDVASVFLFGSSGIGRASSLLTEASSPALVIQQCRPCILPDVLQHPAASSIC